MNSHSLPDWYVFLIVMLALLGLVFLAAWVIAHDLYRTEQRNAATAQQREQQLQKLLDEYAGRKALLGDLLHFVVFRSGEWVVIKDTDRADYMLDQRVLLVVPLGVVLNAPQTAREAKTDVPNTTG